MIPNLSPRDWELLSAYMDRQLKPNEKAALEARLSADPALSAALGELQRTRDALRSLPRLRAPRNFTLTPQMVGQRSAVGRLFAPRARATSRLAPVLGFASALATFLLILVVVGDLLGILAPSTGQVAQAPTQAPEVAVQQMPQTESRQVLTDTLEAPAAVPMLGAASQPTSTAALTESIQLSAQAITETTPLTMALSAVAPFAQDEQTPAFTETETAPLSMTSKLAPEMGVGGGGLPELGNDQPVYKSFNTTNEPMWVTTLQVTVSPTETLTFPMTITLDSAPMTDTMEVTVENDLPPGPTTEGAAEPTRIAEPESPEPAATSTPETVSRLEETPIAPQPESQTFQPAPLPSETPPAAALIPQAARADRSVVRILEILLASVALAAGLAAAWVWWTKRI
jgi:anti-sigma factor RsiW